MYHIPMSTIVILLLLALFSASNAQLFVSNPKHIYPNISGDNAVTQMIGVPMTACSQTVVIRDDSDQCYKYADMDGKVYDWACTPEMKEAFDMVIYASAGYLIMPNANIIIIDMYSGDPLDIVPPTSWNGIGTTLTEPYKVGLWTSFATPTLTHTWVVADKRVNTSFYHLSWTQDPQNGWSNTYSGYYIMQLNNTSPVMTIFSSLASHFMVVLEGGNEVFIYKWERFNNNNNKLVRKIGGFGVISAVSGDFYGRIWVWDTGCNCLKVVRASDGVIVYQTELPDVVNPINIQTTRNKVFIHHENGVTRYDLPALGGTFTPPAVQTCASTGNPLWINATGGAPPYTTRVIPDIIILQSGAQIPSFSYNYTTTEARYREPYTNIATLYDDHLAPEYEIVATEGGNFSVNTPASVMPPFSGNTSISMLMNREARYTLRSEAGFSAAYFSALEMWVNVGSGLGRWRIDLSSGSFYYYDYYTGDFAPNTWTKVTFDFSLFGRLNYNSIVFADYSNSNSSDHVLYVDKIRLIPYDNSDLRLMVRDFCNATVISPWYSYWNGDSILKASVESTDGVCAAGETGNATASLQGSATGGVPPYKYSWSFSGSNSSSLSNLPAFSSNEEIYVDSVASEFQDMSFGPRNAADATHFVSGPHSYSMVPSGELSALVFFTRNGFKGTEFQSIDFWVHGGGVGGQLVTAGLIDGDFDEYNEVLINRILTPATPSIPSSVWAKVSFPIPAVSDTFYGFVIRASGSDVQPTIYFDDIKLMRSEYTLTVTDAANCKSVTSDFSVNSPTPIDVESVINHVTCNGGSDGTVELQISEGTAPYRITWDGASSSTSKSNVQAGVYSVSITDSNNCTPRETVVEVLQPPVLSAVTNVVAPKCHGGNGTVTAYAIGGVPTYTYTWSSSNSFNFPSRPSPVAIFTDSFQGSFLSENAAETEIVCSAEFAAQSGYCALVVAPLPTSASVLSVGCANCFDFSLYSSIKLWINLLDSVNPQLTAVFMTSEEVVYSKAVNTTAGAGWAEVTITLPSAGVADSFILTKGDSATTVFLVDSISIVPRSLVSHDGADADSGFTSIISGPAGNYTISISDSQSCLSAVQNVVIIQPTAISITFAIANPSQSRAGNVSAIVHGGNAPYTYYWPHFNLNAPSVSVTAEGTYSVVVTDSNGCENHAIVTISADPSSSTTSTSPSSASSLSYYLSLLVISMTFAFLL